MGFEPIRPSAEDSPGEEPEGHRPGFITVVLTLIVLLAMIFSLVWPLFQRQYHRPPTPTPTPILLREA